MKEEINKRERYSVFYGIGDYGTIGDIKNETYEGDYSSSSEAMMTLTFAQISDPNNWAYIYDNKKKDFHSYTNNFKG